MIGKIWQRYFLKHLLKILFLFLSCFYGLYILIDYASRTSSFNHAHLQWQGILAYYGYVFSNRIEVLLPIALLIAFVKTVCSLNTNHELVALMAGGISKKRLLSPFLFIAFICTGCLYINEQFFLPNALIQLRQFENKHKHKPHLSPPISVKHLFLDDESLLVYQNYDPELQQFFDVYWIPSIDHVYRMKYLTPYSNPPKGYYVDVLKRNSQGQLLQEQEFTEFDFPTIPFNAEILQSTIIDAEVLSLSELAQTWWLSDSQANEKESRIVTVFYWRLIAPLFCLLALFIPAFSCMQFSRQLPIFLIYVFSLFGLIAFYMWMDAIQVLAKRQVIDPFWGLWGLFSLIWGYFSIRFLKI